MAQPTHVKKSGRQQKAGTDEQRPARRARARGISPAAAGIGHTHTRAHGHTDAQTETETEKETVTDTDRQTPADTHAATPPPTHRQTQTDRHRHPLTSTPSHPPTHTHPHLGEVHDVNIIPHTRSVGRVVVVTVDAEVRPPPDRHLADEWHQIVRLARGVLFGERKGRVRQVAGGRRRGGGG